MVLIILLLNFNSKFQVALIKIEMTNYNNLFYEAEVDLMIPYVLSVKL